jgi:Arc/MetJ-type ribon-helix-helix transcriptional regulator
MKLSVSLPPEDVATLDDFARSAGLPSRSAAVQHAIKLLRHLELEADYAAAWAEFEASGDAAAWEAAAGDGLARAEG